MKWKSKETRKAFVFLTGLRPPPVAPLSVPFCTPPLFPRVARLQETPPTNRQTFSSGISTLDSKHIPFSTSSFNSI